jgi:hypothetical protein
MKMYGGTGCIAPRVILAPEERYMCGRAPGTHWTGGWLGTQCPSGRCGEETKISRLCRESKTLIQVETSSNATLGFIGRLSGD